MTLLPAAAVWDDRPCDLGEGLFWHPERSQLFWFDILACKLRSRQQDQPLEWRLPERFSAAGWIDRATLFLASETGLWRFDIDQGKLDRLQDLEADDPTTRSNDGRADPFGGFWIGTMGKAAEPGAGAIYRYYRGQVTKLFDNISIPNAICFAPSGQYAYFADTPTQMIRRVPLDHDGWPSAAAETFLDLSSEGLFPDGAVTDAEGGLWNAQWGAARVARYTPDGAFDCALPVGGRHASCPAFGGADLATLFVTTALEAIQDPDAAQGVLYAGSPSTRGRAEPRVLLTCT